MPSKRSRQHTARQVAKEVARAFGARSDWYRLERWYTDAIGLRVFDHTLPPYVRINLPTHIPEDGDETTEES